VLNESYNQVLQIAQGKTSYDREDGVSDYFALLLA
jgi:hypothetical protein